MDPILQPSGAVAAVRYRLGERIGVGGMAEVFRAALVGAEGFERPVAIKRMLPGLEEDPDFFAMFVREARITSSLTHPNIVPVLDLDRDENGRLFQVMELVDGVDLRRLLAGGALSWEVAAYVCAEVLRALAFLHELPELAVVHRDVSPHNVLLSRDGAVKLADFGVAKETTATRITQTGVLKGKIPYMSPEQVEGFDLDGRSDVFAAGVLLHEMITGERLFGASELPARVVLNRILAAPIPPLFDAPAPLAAVCARMLERDRARRYRSAQVALDALLATGLVSMEGRSDLIELVRMHPSCCERTRATRTWTDDTESATARPTAPVTTRARTRAGRAARAPLRFLLALAALVLLFLPRSVARPPRPPVRVDAVTPGPGRRPAAPPVSAPVVPVRRARRRRFEKKKARERARPPPAAQRFDDSLMSPDL